MTAYAVVNPATGETLATSYDVVPDDGPEPTISVVKA